MTTKDEKVKMNVEQLGNGLNVAMFWLSFEFLEIWEWLKIAVVVVVSVVLFTNQIFIVYKYRNEIIIMNIIYVI